MKVLSFLFARVVALKPPCVCSRVLEQCLTRWKEIEGEAREGEPSEWAIQDGLFVWVVCSVSAF